MNERHNDPRSLAMLVVSMLIFGSIGVFRRQIPLSSAFLAFTRGILGGLVVWGFRLARGRERAAKLPGKRRFLLILSGAAIGVNWILLFEAFEHTTVAVATLCYYMQPTIVVLLSPLVFRERLTGKKAACAAAAIVGMALVSGVIGGGDARGGSARGILLGLGAAVFYSAVVMMNKKLGGIDPRQKTIVQLLSAGIVLIPYLLLTGGFRDTAIQGTTLPLLLILGVVHTGIAYLLYFGSMDGLRVQSIALLSYIDPVSALFFSAVFLREPLTVPCIIGAVLIIGSAAVGEWQRKTT